MKTIDCKTLEIAPGEKAVAYVPVPFGLQVEKIDVDPQTAARFKIVRADYIGASAMLHEAGLRCPGLRIELENRGAVAAIGRIFVDVERNLRTMGHEMENVAERFNREVYEARKRQGAN